MADPDRNEILVNFQACTQLENIEECIAVLERHDWNLTEALSSTVAHLETDSSDHPLDIPPEPNIQVQGHQVQPSSSPSWHVASSLIDIPYEPLPSSSYGIPPRFINFTIEYRGRDIPVVLKDTETVGRIKEVLAEDIGISADKQVLRGWNSRQAEDKDVLKSLHLPKEVRLFLLTPATCVSESSMEDSNILEERLTQNFTLLINVPQHNREYSLNFPGTKTVQEVKSDVYHVTDIPVRSQSWKGWPSGADDEQMTLAGAGIGFPCHKLELSQTRDNRRTYTAEAAAMELEQSDDEFEDAAEHFSMDEEIDFEAEPSTLRVKSLIPDGITDETIAVENFTAVFRERYGECHPDFYIGKLDDAIKDALLVRAKEKRLLAVYLHNDTSILANIFCSQILCKETICSYLSQNFVMWPWDMTLESNKNRFLQSCTQQFGSMATTTVRNFKAQQMPLILVITRTRATNEVFTVIQGNVTIEELMSSLIQAVDVFQAQQSAEIKEENEREMREQVKQEQDQAYEESLKADREKAEIKKKEEERILQEEMEEEARKHAEQMKQQEEDMLKEARRQSVADLLPPEPCADSEEPVTMIRVRVPNGSPITRRFLVASPLRHLIHYIVSKGFHLEDYKILTTYPRRDLTTLDENQSFKELKLYPQETVILEER
ncbi:FAS-associated factor 1-like [Tubulanus polymorphus]|uniref:FAS-associated factor 1-like n=1 Tax=Tubulanus polymorphus TaxID=672921 RepID=UPI003DA66E68